MTNIWEKESGEIKAIAYVIETHNNFAVNKSTVEIGKIKANATSEIQIPVELSNNSYKVEILIFEKDLLKIKGKLTISAYPVYDWDDIEHKFYEEKATPFGTSLKVYHDAQSWELSNSQVDFQQIRD